ncbi:MAG TPA: hypothetical protein VK425_12470 [Acidimicrobiales bacterium]|nr:hypothetical protein [Acidimicrobiales bacterium]
MVLEQVPGVCPPVCPEQAAVALARSEQAQAAARHASAWAPRYFASYAVATVAFFVGLALGPGDAARLAATVVWSLFVLGSVLYARRQSILPWSLRRLYLASFVAWGALWAGAMALGLAEARSQAIYWLLAGAVVSTPLVVASVVAHRQ